MEITVSHLSDTELDRRRVHMWPTLEKEPCSIDWVFHETEESYFLDGRVVVETSDGKRIEVKKGDFTVFPKGLSCTWHILEPLRKHFNLKND